jgi:di/tricarboxylate transporter
MYLQPLVYAIMLGASASFATAIGCQTNTLVSAAGNYRFSEFLRMGLVMNIAVASQFGCRMIFDKDVAK